MSLPTNDQGPIGDVHPGMDVVDVEGEKVGTVEDVRMGDPAAATSAGQEQASPDGIVGAVADVLTARDGLADADRERLERLGYLRIEGAGLLTGRRYVASDQIAAVNDDVVHLSVPGSHAVG